MEGARTRASRTMGSKKREILCHFLRASAPGFSRVSCGPKNEWKYTALIPWEVDGEGGLAHRGKERYDDHRTVRVSGKRC